MPLFTCIVTVNDSTFESPEQCWSSKEAQNVAAQVAFNYFSPFTAAPQQQIPVNSGGQEHAFSGSSASTIRLDAKAATRGKVEQNMQFGTPHADMLTIYGEGLLHTYKNQLQIYAQKRNLALPEYLGQIVCPPHDRRYMSKVTVDEKSFETPDKSLLQEHAQKEGLWFPTYVSTVEIGGKSYHRQEAKTKNLTETNVANAAYICLTEF